MSQISEDIRIAPASMDYAESYNRTMSEVSEEGKYLSVSTGFEPDNTRAFLADVIKCGYPAYFVFDKDDNVIGWCDIVEREEYLDRRTGSLGIGLLKEYRNCGIGRLLMETALNAAMRYGFERIILDVRESNERARHLYEIMGFEYDPENNSTLSTNDGNETVLRMCLDLSDSAPEAAYKPGCAFWGMIIGGGCIIGVIIALLCILA